MKDVLGTIVNFRKNEITNNETGEVKTMYFVNFALENLSKIENHYGPLLLESVASEDSFNLLNSNLGKRVKVDISEQPVFGKTNQYKRIITKINGVNIRNF